MFQEAMAAPAALENDGPEEALTPAEAALEELEALCWREFGVGLTYGEEWTPRKPAAALAAVRELRSVPNARLREHFLTLKALDESRPEWATRQDVGAADGFLVGVAVRAGIVDRSGRADTSHLQRVLGVLPTAPSKRDGKTYPGRYRQFVDYDLAVSLAQALGLDPHEVGV